MNSNIAHTAVKEFRTAVNMSPKALTAWLKTAESKAVGFKATEGSESVGHQSGKKIVKLPEKPEANLPTTISRTPARSWASFTGIWRSGPRPTSCTAAGAIR